MFRIHETNERKETLTGGSTTIWWNPTLDAMLVEGLLAGLLEGLPEDGIMLGLRYSICNLGL